MAGTDPLPRSATVGTYALVHARCGRDVTVASGNRYTRRLWEADADPLCRAAGDCPGHPRRGGRRRARLGPRRCCHLRHECRRCRFESLAARHGAAHVSEDTNLLRGDPEFGELYRQPCYQLEVAP